MTVPHATLAPLVCVLTGQISPATLTAVGLVGVTLLLLVWALGRPASVPVVAGTGIGRPGSARTVYVRLRHPASAGRPRPRAPSAGPAPR